MVAALVAAVVVASVSHGQLRRADSTLATTRTELRHTLAVVASSRTELLAVTGRAEVAGQTLTAAAAQLATDQTRLARAQADQFYQGSQINQLDLCLAGVEKALNQFSPTLRCRGHAGGSGGQLPERGADRNMTAPTLPTRPPGRQQDEAPPGAPTTRATRSHHRRLAGGRARWAVPAVLAAVLVAAVTYDVITVSSDHRVNAAIRTDEARVSHARSALSDNRSGIAATTATLEARQQAAARDTDEIGSTTRSLDASAQTNYFQTLDIATLRTCLSGVSTATTDIASADLQVWSARSPRPSTACGTLDSANGGLVYPFNFPDPFVLSVGNEYYAFATNSAAGNIQIIDSSDLTHWTTVGDALPTWPRGPSPVTPGDHPCFSAVPTTSFITLRSTAPPERSASPTPSPPSRPDRTSTVRRSRWCAS